MTKTNTDKNTTTTKTKHANRRVAPASQTILRERLLDEAEGRLIRVGEEFAGGFDVIEKYDRTVTIFGSARLPADHPASQKTYKIAAKLAKAGYAVATGGGHGIMAAGNKGAFEAGGASIGINIQLPMEQTLNPYTTDHYEFKHFFARKVLLTLGSHAYIYCPGGFGTMDELFEVITLMQTSKIPKAPIILVDSEFWKPLDAFIRQVLLRDYEVISPEDTELYKIVDDVDTIVRMVVDATQSAANGTA